MVALMAPTIQGSNPAPDGNPRRDATSATNACAPCATGQGSCPHDCRTPDEIELIARALEAHGRFGLTRGFIQHGSVSVYHHVCSVARASLAMANRLERLGLHIDRPSLIRGALLHDYFLYDWHDPDPSHRLHGFTHPFAALARAEEDFDLTSRERNIISRHMFPLVPIPPTCREAWIVCMADKACALAETVSSRLPKRRACTQGEAQA